jgi:carboxymethylenebutenolidase
MTAHQTAVGDSAVAEVTIDTTDGPMPALAGIPDGPARGAIVVIQEAFGLTGHIADVCKRLSAEGWLAVAPGIYHRWGMADFGYDDLPPALGAMKKLNPLQLHIDLDATFAWIRAHGLDAAHSAIVGFCMGGAISMWAGTAQYSADAPVAASISWYAGGVGAGRFGLPRLIDLVGEVSVPWLGLYGDLDRSITPEEISELNRASRAVTGIATELVRYPYAGHGFNCDDRPDHFVPAAAADGWARMRVWLDRYVPRATA